MTHISGDGAPMLTLRVGCAMWAHPPWVGRYLSPAHRGRELADYATWCNAVEGNTTFYATPSAATVARWADQAPPDFRFAFKAPRTVTHDRRLRHEAHRDLAAFLRAIEPLGERVGPVQLQLPPSFGPDQLDTLVDFVRRLPTSHQWVVELRHAAFFDRGHAHLTLDEAFVAADIGRVVLDTRPLYSAPALTTAAEEERRTKPHLAVHTEVMGRAPIVRVIGAGDRAATIDGLRAWVPTVVRWLRQGFEPFVFAHQPENLESPDLARAFHHMIRSEVPELTPLPDPSPVDDDGEIAGQATLI